MKYACQILSILAACLVLTPLFAAAGQPEYPKHFLDLSIPQLPGSKVVEVRFKGKVPVTVVLESEDTHSGVDVIFFYSGDSKPLADVWYYDDDASHRLERERDTENILLINKLDGTNLLIKMTPKGKMGSRVELTYPWVDPTEGWFEKLLEEGVKAK